MSNLFAGVPSVRTGDEGGEGRSSRLPGVYSAFSARPETLFGRLLIFVFKTVFGLARRSPPLVQYGRSGRLADGGCLAVTYSCIYAVTVFL